MRICSGHERGRLFHRPVRAQETQRAHREGLRLASVRHARVNAALPYTLSYFTSPLYAELYFPFSLYPVTEARPFQKIYLVFIA